MLRKPRLAWDFRAVGRLGVWVDLPVVLRDSDRLHFVKRTKDILDVPGLRIERVGTDSPGVEPDPPLSHRVVVFIIPDSVEFAESNPDVTDALRRGRVRWCGGQGDIRGAVLLMGLRAKALH